MSDYEEIEQGIKKIKKHKRWLIAQKNIYERKIEEIQDLEKDLLLMLIDSLTPKEEKTENERHDF